MCAHRVEVLEHHRELGADALQLLVIAPLAGAVRSGFGVDHFAVDDDVPAFGRSRKLMQRRKVLLPEPLEPMMLITSPSFAFSDTPLSTSLSPYCLCRSSTAAYTFSMDTPSLPVECSRPQLPFGSSIQCPCGLPDNASHAAFGAAEQPNQRKNDRRVKHGGDAEGVERCVGGRVDVARDLQDVRHGGGERDRGGMQHQDHFVAVVRQRAAQRRRQNDAGVQREPGHAITPAPLRFRRTGVELIAPAKISVVYAQVFSENASSVQCIPLRKNASSSSCERTNSRLYMPV